MMANARERRPAGIRLRRIPALHTARPARAFTLVEILIAVGLLAIVVGLLFVPISSSLGYFRTATARGDAQTVARNALDAVARELAEAMYVQLDMYDNSMIAFIPPLRVNPDDPNSEVVTPPRPDWSRAIRFWQALNDPTRNYNPGTHLEPGNMFFLARTIVPDPFTVDDPWNRWNDTWAQTQDVTPPSSLTGSGPWPTNWAPIPRMVHTDVDYRTWVTGSPMDRRNSTLQPGYPYLAAIYNSYGTKLNADQVRAYRSAVVGLTPNAPEYDIPQLAFNPTVAAGERLRPVEGASGPDYTIYRARYPLWRQGTAYTGWSALASNPDLVAQMKAKGMDQWARDPFLLIAQYVPLVSGSSYELVAIGAFDPRTRTMQVLDIVRNLFYDTGTAPEARVIPTALTEPWYGFSIDWIDGSMRFDFPQTMFVPDNPYTASDPWVQVTAGTQTVGFDHALNPFWETGYTPGDALGIFVIPDSVTVRRVEVNVDDRGYVTGVLRVLGTLKRVFCTPHDRSDEFQLGLYPTIAASDPSQPRYGWIRLPPTLADGLAPGEYDVPNGTGTTKRVLQVEYSWRNNGLVPAGANMSMSDEKPDLITAYYRTDAVIDISLTVSRADPSAPPGERIAQSVYLTRRVKLHNLLREIRYAER